MLSFSSSTGSLFGSEHSISILMHKYTDRVEFEEHPEITALMR